MGICLGMQLVTNHSEEGDVQGFRMDRCYTKN
ncbi:MAG: hypothetical protein IPJ13_13045 [Saprospiraceae bacterium]|nr:hypothetical protein [Saprospiraceae bacterium]